MASDMAYDNGFDICCLEINADVGMNCLDYIYH